MHSAVCTHLFSTYFLKASRKMSLRLLIIGKSRARCSSFCSFSLKSLSSISFANPMPFAPFWLAVILFLGDFNGNEMLNTTIINNTYRQTVSFIEAVHGGIDFNRFVHFIVDNLITASIYQWHTKYKWNSDEMQFSQPKINKMCCAVLPHFTVFMCTFDLRQHNRT